MSNVDVALNELIQAIKTSEQYTEYKKQLTLVKEEPDLKEQIDAFRQQNFDLQNSQDCDFNKIDEFEKKYKDFREKPLVSDFLAAELAFCRLMQEVDERIVEAVDFE